MDAKQLLQSLIAEVYDYNVVYKYLDFNGAVAMLTNSNLQFTRADHLNDDLDCNIDSIIDFSALKAFDFDPSFKLQYREKLKNEIGQCGILSVAKSYNNKCLWEGYSRSGMQDDVVCIELNPKRIIQELGKPLFQVHYFKNPSNCIPIEWLFPESGIYAKNLFFSKFYTTKYQWNASQTKCWELEDELRFINVEPQVDPFYRISVPFDFFQTVYIKKNMPKELQDKLKQCSRQKNNIRIID